MQDKTINRTCGLNRSIEGLQDHRLLCLAADWAEYGHQLAVTCYSHMGVIAASIGSHDHGAGYGNRQGSVSSGCEETVIEAGLEAILSGEGRVLILV